MLVVLSASSAFAAGSNERIEETFDAANHLYRDEKYDDAGTAYEQILAQKKESAAVYYNLGNAYFRKGEMAKALLNYERALKLSPRDSDARYNLRYVRSLFPEKVLSEKSFFTGVIDGFLSFYSIDEMVLITTIFFVCICLLVLVISYPKWSFRWEKVLACILAVFFILFAAGIFIKVQIEGNAAIVLLDTDSKFEPRKDSTSYFHLGKGEKIKILHSEDDWAKIQRTDGKLGWVPRDIFEKI